MSFGVLKSALDKEERRYIAETFTVRKKVFADKPETKFCYESHDGAVFLPLNAWSDFFDEFPNEDFDKAKFKFTKELYTTDSDPKPLTDPKAIPRDQDVIAKKTIKLLKKYHSAFISCYPGFGKTLMAINIHSKLKVKGLIICFTTEILDQWPIAFEDATTGKANIIKGKNGFDKNADLNAVGVFKALNMIEENPDIFDGIGMVIVDEAHQVTETTFTKLLFYIQPNYLLGLSATPVRNDGLDKLFELYFGSREKFIVREQKKTARVIKYLTPFKHKREFKMVKGKSVPDWSVVLNTLEGNPERHQEIAEIALRHPDDKILIINDRNSQTLGVYNILVNELGEEQIGLAMGNNKKWDKTKRIIVAGIRKCGTGVDIPGLTMMILATPVSGKTRTLQVFGRLRKSNVIVYDLVDNTSTMESKWENREKVYLSIEGIEIIEERSPNYFGKPEPIRKKRLAYSER